jgi:superoxide dismutase
MAFELPDLPYAHDALADLGMSQETLEYHHDLHHKAYVDNGNKLIEGTEWADKSPRGHHHRHIPGRRGGAERHLQQRLPALEPHAVLGNDGPRHRRDAR